MKIKPKRTKGLKKKNTLKDDSGNLELKELRKLRNLSLKESFWEDIFEKEIAEFLGFLTKEDHWSWVEGESWKLTQNPEKQARAPGRLGSGSCRASEEGGTTVLSGTWDPVETHHQSLKPSWVIRIQIRRWDWKGETGFDASNLSFFRKCILTFPMSLILEEWLNHLCATLQWTGLEKEGIVRGGLIKHTSKSKIHYYYKNKCPL